MKIGLILYGSLDQMSGGYLYDRKLVEYLKAQGNFVDLLSLRQAGYLGHLAQGLNFHLPSGFDILIQDELCHPSLLAANASSHPCPLIALVHNLHSSEKRSPWQNAFYRTVEKQYLRSVDGFIFNSQTTRDVVFSLIHEESPHVIATPAGDRLGTLSPDRIRARAYEPGPLRLLFLANLTPNKGLHVLLDALQHLRAAVRLDIAGSLQVDEKYARAQRRTAAALDPAIQVYFHGVLDGEPLADLLRQAQMLVIPSFYEGFGIAYLEGMAFGLPAIGTRAGAIPHLITDEENGFLIAPGDSESLARRLQQLADDRDQLAALSLNARKHFDEFPTWDRSASAIYNFLKSMLPANPVKA